jgi:hypothetical protein
MENNIQEPESSVLVGTYAGCKSTAEEVEFTQFAIEKHRKENPKEYKELQHFFDSLPEQLKTARSKQLHTYSV